jgi:hypothetical protein
MVGAEQEVQYLVLGGTDPYLLARVRWPDVAQAISEDCPRWLDDPGLFDLPYERESTKVSPGRAAEIAAEWGTQLPAPSSTGFSEPRLRRIPATWSDMVPVERRAWALEHVTTAHRPEASSAANAAVARNGNGRLPPDAAAVNGRGRHAQDSPAARRGKGRHARP